MKIYWKKVWINFKMPKIIVDHRESNSGIIKELIKKDIEVEKQQLITADFIIQTKDLNNEIQTVGVERKKQNDFINSIIDKRIINQLRNLKENFTVPLLIIEGSDNIYEIRKFHPNAIRGMLASIAVDYQIPMIHTRNYRDTAALLSVIAKRLEKPKRLISLLRKRKPLSLTEHQELILESLPGVGPIIAKSLLKRFKTVKDVVNADEKELQLVEKIGKKKAVEIKKVIEKDYSG